MIETAKRSILKAVTYRLIGSFVTGSLVWLFTGKLDFAVAIGSIDTILKILGYYVHERIWQKISYGKAKPIEYEI